MNTDMEVQLTDAHKKALKKKNDRNTEKKKGRKSEQTKEPSENERKPPPNKRKSQENSDKNARKDHRNTKKKQMPSIIVDGILPLRIGAQEALQHGLEEKCSIQVNNKGTTESVRKNINIKSRHVEEKSELEKFHEAVMKPSQVLSTPTEHNVSPVNAAGTEDHPEYTENSKMDSVEAFSFALGFYPAHTISISDFYKLDGG
ncbi:hypothetical protein JTB14_006762 [Gonioctena quinquepunctata]|nr:hypothetical protein JTB14_006762 [Gonioctena quinquepunctata]